MSELDPARYVAKNLAGDWIANTLQNRRAPLLTPACMNARHIFPELRRLQAQFQRRDRRKVS